MIPTAVLSLLLVSPPTPIQFETVRTLDLARLSFTEARQLEGQTIRVTFVVGKVDGELLFPDIAQGVGVNKDYWTLWAVYLPHAPKPGRIKLGDHVLIQGQIKTRLLIETYGKETAVLIHDIEIRGELCLN